MFVYSVPSISTLGHRTLVSPLGISTLGMSPIHSAFLLRKKRDAPEQPADQQADSNMFVYNMPSISTLGHRTLVSPLAMNTLGMSAIHSPFIFRKKRDTSTLDQHAEKSMLMYSIPSMNVWNNGALNRMLWI